MFNSLSCFSDTYLIIYRKRKNKKSRERGQTKQEEREPWRRMPPTYRQFIASPSAPSDVFTIHTIDSRSYLTTSHNHRRDGRTPRPLLGDAIATTSQHLASDLSPVPRISSAPSDVFIIHTIDNRSPHRHRCTSNQGEGRAATLSASSSAQSSSPPSGGEGRAESQPGRATPSR